MLEQLVEAGDHAGLDDAPVVNDTLVTTPEETPITVCVNVIDVDGGANTVSVGCLVNGTATITGNCITYTPNPNF
ncbi:hypothetical protein EBT25_17325 [bacterium]|nr:hypothetical protein [bacterium]